MYNAHANFADLSLRETEDTIRVYYSNINKPSINRPLLARWQRSVETLSTYLGVAVAFVTQLSSDTLEIIVASSHNIKSFQVGSKLSLHRDGAYSETTIGKGEMFIVRDAYDSPIWKALAESTGAASYIGVPIRWPDGEAFGSLCVAHTVAHPTIDNFANIIYDYQRLFELDLEHLMHIELLSEVQEKADVRLVEVNHRAKNHFSILSNLIQIISHRPIVNARQVLLDIDAKIRTMSLLHEMLYSVRTEDVSIEKRIASFLEDVIVVTASLSPTPVRVTADFRDLPQLDERYIFDLSLLLSELTTNAIKHSNARELSLTIYSKVIDDTTLSLTFRDNGDGFSDEFLSYPDRAGGIGFSILRNFTRLLDGYYQQYNDDGAVTKLVVRS